MSHTIKCYTKHKFRNIDGEFEKKKETSTKLSDPTPLSEDYVKEFNKHWDITGRYYYEDKEATEEYLKHVEKKKSSKKDDKEINTTEQA